MAGAGTGSTPWAQRTWPLPTCTGDTATYMGDKKTDYRGVVWYKIAFRNGKGWVSSKFSKLV